MPLSIVVHGGAWAIPDSVAASTEAGCARAAQAGYLILEAGGSAVEAVEAAVRVLEDDPVFDAGTGSVLNAAGDVEMDAMIMSGADLSTGCVVGCSRVSHPITLARIIKDKTSHCMFTGPGAERVAEANGMALVDPASLVTAAARAEWERFKKYNHTVDTLFASRKEEEKSKGGTGHDTVGAVALDTEGHVAAATSTGGITAKSVGRVGDSPLPGCGGYADDVSGAVSCTGHGESILRVGLAHRVLAAAGSRSTGVSVHPQAAAEAALAFMQTRVGGQGGCIVVDPTGRVGMAHTTTRMAFASIESARGGLEGMRQGLTVVTSGI